MQDNNSTQKIRVSLLIQIPYQTVIQLFDLF